MLPFKRKEVIGNATLYLADCYELLPHLGFMDAVVTDPPYLFEAKGGKFFGRGKRGCMGDIRRQGLDKGFDHLFLTAKQFGSIVVFCHNNQLADLILHIQGEWERFALCAWHKLNPMPVANRHYVSDTEHYIHGWLKGYHPIGRIVDLSRYILSFNGQDKRVAHPTVKPQVVMSKIIGNVQGQVICDPFMGSGSTGLAAIKACRHFVGIEKNEDYFDLACSRILENYNQLEMFEGDDFAPEGFLDKGAISNGYR